MRVKIARNRVCNSLYHEEINVHYLENLIMQHHPSPHYCIDLRKYPYRGMMSRAQMDIY